MISLKIISLALMLMLLTAQSTSNPCNACGAECAKACGTNYFRGCCLNFIRKRRYDMSQAVSNDVDGGGGGGGDQWPAKRFSVSELKAPIGRRRVDRPSIAYVVDYQQEKHSDQEDNIAQWSH